MFVVSPLICKKSGFEAPENASNLYFAQASELPMTETDLKLMAAVGYAVIVISVSAIIGLPT